MNEAEFVKWRLLGKEAWYMEVDKYLTKANGNKKDTAARKHIFWEFCWLEGRSPKAAVKHRFEAWSPDSPQAPKWRDRTGVGEGAWYVP
jgi:hypothetical protein